MFPFEKYKYYVDEKAKTIVAVQTFAGKKYRGIAVCRDDDVFDVEKGKILAALKCNLKIVKARSNWANKLYKFSKESMDYAIKMCDKRKEYMIDSLKEEAIAYETLTEFQKKM